MGKLKVLVVEDDKSVRTTERQILEDTFDILEAGDGEQALQVLSAQNVDIMLLDLHMPKMDGEAVLGAIDPPPPVVIVVSAFEYVQETDFHQENGSKVKIFLRKPVAPQRLIDTVEKVAAELRYEAS